MIFLSKNGDDGYIEYLARGARGKIVDSREFIYEDSDEPIVLRGILKDSIMKKCWRDHRPFYYVDTGYFGNEKTTVNPNGWKYWHRIVKNDLQHSTIVDRPDDRFKLFNKKINPWRKSGRKILIAAPDEKPCKFYGIDKEEWLKETVDTIKQYTDRPIVVRERAKLRADRITTNTLAEALADDVFALVTYNSVAATESVFLGIPTFTLAPNAAGPVASQDLSKIETPNYADSDLIYKWACHLAYGQFHVNEMKTGSVWRIINE